MKRWFTRRRLVVVLLCVGAFGTWKWTHGHDPQLVGPWLVTEDAPATAEQLQAVTDGTKTVPHTIWTLQGDGAGRLNALQPSGLGLDKRYSDLHWWTSGDRLRIMWEGDATGWVRIKLIVGDAWHVLRGQPARRVDEYDYTVQEPELIRVVIEEQRLSQQSRRVLYLTRLPENDP